MNILLVCTGNTCRSVMAEALLDDAVDRSKRLESVIKTDSAGTFAAEDQAATASAIKVLEEMGVEVGKHRSKQIDEELVEWADIILTMEIAQFEQIEAMFPQAEGKMHTLRGFAEGEMGFPGEGFDMEDPYDEDIDEYREFALQLKDVIAKIASKLEQYIEED